MAILRSFPVTNSTPRSQTFQRAPGAPRPVVRTAMQTTPRPHPNTAHHASMVAQASRVPKLAALFTHATRGATRGTRQ